MRQRLILKGTEHLYKRYVLASTYEGEGTNVHLQILERDPEGKDKAPEVMKNSFDAHVKPNTNPAGSSQSRSYSTTSRRNAEIVEVSSSSQMSPPPSLEYPNGGLGHKFGLPDMPLPRTEHFRGRYDPVVEQLTKSLMKHGKLSVAQKVRSSRLLRCSTSESTFGHSMLLLICS